MRELLDIDEATENKFLKELEESDMVQLTGDLVSVVDVDLPRSVLNEMIDRLKIPIEKVVDLFVKKT